MILGIFFTTLFHISSKGLLLVHNNFRKVRLLSIPQGGASRGDWDLEGAFFFFKTQLPHVASMTKEIPAQGGWADQTRAASQGRCVTHVRCQLEHRRLRNTHAQVHPVKSFHIDKPRDFN